MFTSVGYEWKDNANEKEDKEFSCDLDLYEPPNEVCLKYNNRIRPQISSIDSEIDVCEGDVNGCVTAL